jgi:hypothetical protein
MARQSRYAWRRSGKELIVFHLVLGTIVCLFTARIDCFSLFFFKVGMHAFVTQRQGMPMKVTAPFECCPLGSTGQELPTCTLVSPYAALLANRAT